MDRYTFVHERHKICHNLNLLESKWVELKSQAVAEVYSSGGPTFSTECKAMMYTGFVLHISPFLFQMIILFYDLARDWTHSTSVSGHKLHKLFSWCYSSTSWIIKNTKTKKHLVGASTIRCVGGRLSPTLAQCFLPFPSGKDSLNLFLLCNIQSWSPLLAPTNVKYIMWNIFF